jgi:superfamily II DNA/RNA helicase
VDRRPPTWEFFPSQIEAIQADFLTSDESYSLQMPTSAGKTTLCETLLFKFLKSHPDDVAVMLVPYRSLAAELKGTLIRRLNAVGLASRCAYGGTVPTGDEIHDLATTRAIVATPEALTGLIGADLVFAKRIGLIICDEGHLLDGGERGIGLELLLARLRARQDRPTRFVFMSAIVPNIEEINAWLGGTDQTVLRSTYRPAIAEFAVLKPLGSGNNTVVGMDMHPHEVRERRFSIDQFLNKNDFEFRNPATRRINTYNFESKKTQVIATARRALSMGCTAIFAMNKTGPQGAIGIAESLVAQLQNELPLPKPINFTHPDVLRRTVAYLEDEYTAEWIGTVSVKNGAVLHHGDIPQETREVLESLIRNENVKLIICTSTLAEGVNLPVRTLILYSVERRNNDSVQNMLARDIKNLVGRAGRAGVNTKGLVICANYEQWRYVQPVAMHGAGEPVKGALFDFINLLTDVLLHNNIQLSNEFMEEHSEVFPVIDGVDATLIELLSNEIGEEEFVAIATNLAAQTFAARQLSEASAENLRSIFALRARNLIALRSGGKTAWARETGAKARLIGSVELNLLPLRADWQVEVDPLSDEARSIIFQWAWDHVSLREKMTKCFRLKEGVDPETVKDTFFEVARLWMSGMQFKEIASLTNLPMDDLLAVHCLGITFSLQTLVEQGFSLLAKRLESEGVALAEGFVNFSEHLRFGCPSAAARMLAASGVRHRKAYVKLGEFLQSAPGVVNQSDAKGAASATMRQYYDHWRGILGDLVYQNTLSDLSA